ncbi:MAG: endoglucanase A [Actinobacteria bacterium]|nr:endoglucanase A [Actinomycetota bacterium]
MRGARWWKPAVTLAVAGSVVAMNACTVPPPPPPPITPGDPGASDVSFTITSNQGVHPISPFIYGANSTRNIAANKQTLVRQGGNRWTAYNWENNASNAGSDWCFQNDGYLSSSNTPGAAVKPTIDLATANGAANLVTIPIVDYVAADKNSPNGCDDVRNSGANYLSTRFEQNRAAKPGGSFTTNPPPADDYVYQDEYVNWLKVNAPNANIMFSLDNEPDLWSATHAEVHPSNASYAELANRNIQFATAIKNVMPGAPVVGPVNYGFYGFETLQGAPDAGANGNFLDWWLDQMKAADTAAGRRLVDVMDLHWYPEATGGGQRITVADGGASVAAARVQAPRSLWDPTFVENSWISNPDQYNYGAIKLIPRMKDRIAARDPGIGLGFSEWNYGGGDVISGAIATADVLGIFGRENVSLANMWELNGNESYTYAAFRAFRNYDGSGSSFGNVSVSAVASDNATGSVYASTDSTNPNRVVIIAINKATTAKRAGIRLAHPNAFTGAKVYTLTAGGGANIVAQPDISTVATNAYNYTMPASSVSIIVPQ